MDAVLAHTVRRQPFDIRKGFVVLKSFVYNGLPQAVGDAFDWRKLGVPERLLGRLWLQRKIEAAVKAPEPVSPPPARQPTRKK